MIMSMPVLVLLAAGVAAAATHPGDAVAMRSLANTTGAAKTLQWGASSPDPCGGTWVGVTGNGEGRVTASPCCRSRSAASAPSTSAPTPYSKSSTYGFFAAFPALETFNLDDNEMSTMKPWIPYDVMSCPSRRSFSAMNVHFAGGFPNYFGNATLFPELESLSLARNLLWGEITPEFGKNSKIKFLDVSQQGHDEDARPDDVMRGVLSFVSGMPNLVEAHHEHNVFKGPLPEATNLTNLRVFDVSDNDLCGIAKFPAGVTVNVAGNPRVGTPCP
uniref:Leucine-rich repeat-containing N-terminal plant-type domain-containing protein n=1 Tax=Oryza punctata TaxID=4537 RepID=A0A0E0M826_ORYPU